MMYVVGVSMSGVSHWICRGRAVSSRVYVRRLRERHCHDVRLAAETLY
jgi:hypothetical protein